MSVQAGVVAAYAASERLTRAQAASFQKLVDLMGHVANGSEQTVTLFQDDATHACWVQVGTEPRDRSYFGNSLEEAIDSAFAATWAHGLSQASKSGRNATGRSTTATESESL